MTAMQTDRTILPLELFRRLQPGAGASACLLLDVRTPGEFAAAHVPGARLVPLDQLDAAAFLKERGADDKPIYVLCEAGGRAKRAMEKFRRAGFDGCVLVEGGTRAWMDADLPVTRGKSTVLPLMRQVQLVVGGVSAVGAVLALTVNPWYALVPLVTGTGLFFAGATGFCGLALVLAKMPWNRVGNCNSSSCTK
jgi:rhodanese-related sulfurtransferase